MPTHNRPAMLTRTLRAIGRLDIDRPCELLIADNASETPPETPIRLDNDIPVRLIRLETNHGAAARNIAAAEATGEWIVMLDDDSWPLDDGFVQVIDEVDPDVAAIGAEIILPDGQRESGGLPEVFIGCGVAIRRDVYLDAKGYDEDFHYYVEEYDLAAKFLRGGHRIIHDFRFRVHHEKAATGRDMNMIIRRLVRNNGWIAKRYAPASCRKAALREVTQRYRQIAVKEAARRGYYRGLADLYATLRRQPCREMSQSMFDRFTGLAQVRETLRAMPDVGDGRRVAVVDEGKNDWVVHQALRERSVRVMPNERDADVLIIGTLSPGPMMDAFERRLDEGRNVILPWTPRHARAADELLLAAGAREE